jgi:hypothetical protein
VAPTPDQLLADFRRYEQITAGLLRDARVPLPSGESAATVQVERGAILASAIAGDGIDASAVDRLAELSSSATIDQLAQVSVVDAAGHARPVYRPLLIYAWLMSYRIAYETLPPATFGRWDEALRPWCDLLESELGPIGVSETATPAIRGGSAAEAAWTALALHVAGKIFVRDAWTDLAADTFGRLARGQQPGGAFLLAAASDNPEPMWYHELAILHAAASYAVQAEDRTVARAVATSSAFVLNEIEPDHATAQPWGLFAFIWNPNARPLADQLLHAVEMRRPAQQSAQPSPQQSAPPQEQPQSLDGVTLILLADALYCLRLFTDPASAKP